MTKRTPFRLALLWLGFGIIVANATAAVWHVDIDNAGTENGTSGAKALKTIQAAADSASTAGGEVWVAEGTYTATTNLVVTMKANVAPYGNFEATETLRSSFSLWFWMLPAKCQPKGCTTNVVHVRACS